MLNWTNYPFDADFECTPNEKALKTMDCSVSQGLFDVEIQDLVGLCSPRNAIVIPSASTKGVTGSAYRL